MPRKRLYTFIIAPSHAEGRLWRLSLPYPVLIALVLSMLGGGVAAVVATCHYGRMLVRVADYDQLLAENDSFRSENHNYKIQTAQLGEKIDFLDSLSRKLMVYSGMNSEKGVGGVGGVSPDNFAQPLPASAGTLKAIDQYNQSLKALDKRYNGLDEYISNKMMVEATTPSAWPVRGYITGGMGRREDPFNGARTETHTGVDISAPHGTRVEASGDGVVIFAGTREGYGKIVVIDHKFGVVTRYGHLSKFNVKVGQRVFRGETIGYVGATGRATGPHLHFEIWVQNHPVNPLRYLSRAAGG
jgi:murein DD-endopeptidase MepM/ murein hydrolase activator NlpD